MDINLKRLLLLGLDPIITTLSKICLVLKVERRVLSLNGSSGLPGSFFDWLGLPQDEPFRKKSSIAMIVTSIQNGL